MTTMVTLAILAGDVSHGEGGREGDEEGRGEREREGGLHACMHAPWPCLMLAMVVAITLAYVFHHLGPFLI